MERTCFIYKDVNEVATTVEWKELREVIFHRYPYPNGTPRFSIAIITDRNSDIPSQIINFNENDRGQSNEIRNRLVRVLEETDVNFIDGTDNSDEHAKVDANDLFIMVVFVIVAGLLNWF